MSDEPHRARQFWDRPGFWFGGVLVAIVTVPATMNLLFSVPEPEAVPTIPVRRAPPDAAGQPAQDALSILFDLKDGDCLSHGIADGPPPDLVGIDARIASTPWVRGWIDGGNGPRAFYGTLEEAVRALGGIEIAIGADGIWFKTSPTTAESIWSLRTPLGRTVWMPKDAAEVGCKPVS